MLIQDSAKGSGEGDGTPHQYFRLKNPMDRGAWWATVHGVAKSQTPLSDLTNLTKSRERENVLGYTKRPSYLELRRGSW